MKFSASVRKPLFWSFTFRVLEIKRINYRFNGCWYIFIRFARATWKQSLEELLTYMPAQPIIIIFSIYKLALIAVDMYIQDLFIWEVICLAFFSRCEIAKAM